MWGSSGKVRGCTWGEYNQDTHMKFSKNKQKYFKILGGNYLH